jgi:hypothetical protein
MAVRLEVDFENRIVRISVDGVFTDRTLLDGYLALRNAVLYYAPCACIVDYTGVTEAPISADTVRWVANKPPAVPMECIHVNIVPQDAVYGLARMFQTLSSETRPNLRVVHTMQEALKLIGVPSPTFSSIEPNFSEPDFGIHPRSTLGREKAS